MSHSSTAPDTSDRSLVVVADDKTAAALIPAPHIPSGRVGGSTYRRRGRDSSIGRTTRRTKEKALEVAAFQRQTKRHAQWVGRRMAIFEHECRRSKEKYGFCCECRCLIIPKSAKHRTFLDKCLESGTRAKICYECNRQRMVRVGKAKFAILRRRGRNPRIVDGQLVCD